MQDAPSPNTGQPCESAIHDKDENSRLHPMHSDITSFDIKKLAELDSEGLIPGPKESPEEFLRRADYCLTLKHHLSQELKTSLSGDENNDPAVLQPAMDSLKHAYGFAPKWIPIFFSNYRLPFWHGGCAWIFQATEDSPIAALIQLRAQFKGSNSFLGIYSREELLTHELTHVGRMAYHEPKFEEVFAYRTSTSAFRRWFGPIVQSSTESVTFILLMFLIIVFDVFLIAMGRLDAYMISLWLKAIPIGIIGYGIVRVVRKQRTLDRCVKNLAQCLGSNSRAQAVAYRLTDAEIVSFSKMSKEEIIDYSRDHSSKELRWRLINICFEKCNF